ncbi:ATP-dependent DNA helicase [Vallicoccus soli]|uniref:ATP-dependent helicase DinG n=2 Tax=Vallicoccus soli TaxID=2339232 RepID=A0A3A3ZKW8_9ACTN|nr:ATP-dependent DNA helicase [Vallicoccus soli]
MAEAVHGAMSSGEHLLVQAGTGTGKSLAYLVPALLHGDTVVVATATIALQGQIVDRDLPRLVDAVAPVLGRRPTFAMLKGRRNYVCRNKVAGGMPVDDEDALFAPAPSTPLGRDVLRVREWAEQTRTGDRDELVPGVGERAWSQVSVSASECLGAQRCPFGEECFAELARAEAADADVVVTNHAMLAIDAIGDGSVLPEHDVVVVDEAHELVDRVTGVATDELTPALVERAASRARKVVGADGTEALESAAGALAAALDPLPEGRLPGLPDALGQVLVLLRDGARAAQSAVAKEKRAEDGARSVASSALQEVHDTAERLLGESAYDVAWLAREPRRGAVLRVAPLHVGGLLRSTLFEDATVVLTSATLELGGSFDLVARQVGLGAQGEGEAARWQGLDVGSPFDYARQGILYVARHLPPPGRGGIDDRALDELADLLAAAGGRALALFSSMRGAVAAAELLRERVDLPILCQGEDSTAELVRRFAADARTCLFGTLSLWQGVDVPGSALQLVVIDRIPFPRPDDPVMSARSAAVDERGGNGFMSVSAAHAALLLAQGAGRLVRQGDDRGVVAVLDARLATARYGRFLRDSMPPFWFTSDREAVLGALRRIDASAPPPRPVAPRPVRARPAAKVPAPPAERVAVVLGKAWTESDDALLRSGVEAERPLGQLALRHECSEEQLVARIESLGLRHREVDEPTLLG